MAKFCVYLSEECPLGNAEPIFVYLVHRDPVGFSNNKP